MKNTSFTKRVGRPLSFDRQKTLELAMRTFWQFGYGGTSIADLTAAMNISAQSLYSAYGSKSDLYHEALDLYQSQYCNSITHALNDGKHCLTSLENMLKAAARIYCDKSHPKGCMIATANLGCASENCAEVQYVSRLRQQSTQRILKRIEEGIGKNELMRSKTNAKSLALHVSIIMQGMSVQAQDGTCEKELIAIAEEVISMIRVKHT